MNTNVKKLTGSAIMLALALVLPFLTMQIPTFGKMLCPMHFPVLLCGMLFGPLWGGAVGFIAPLLRFAIFGMPIIFPTGIAMSAELLTYGLVVGIMVKFLPKKIGFAYISLFTAMIAGRIVWALARTFLTFFGGEAFTFAAFVAGGFVEAAPGILLQILLIPVFYLAFRRAGLALNTKNL